MNSDIVMYGVVAVLVGLFTLSPFGDLLVSPTLGGGSTKVLGGVGFIAIGVVVVLLGVIAKPKPKYQPKVCGNCLYFKTPECIREEKLPNAMPCENFLRKQTA